MLSGSTHTGVPRAPIVSNFFNVGPNEIPRMSSATSHIREVIVAVNILRGKLASHIRASEVEQHETDLD